MGSSGLLLTVLITAALVFLVQADELHSGREKIKQEKEEEELDRQFPGMFKSAEEIEELLRLAELENQPDEDFVDGSSNDETQVCCSSTLTWTKLDSTLTREAFRYPPNTNSEKVKVLGLRALGREQVFNVDIDCMKEQSEFCKDFHCKMVDRYHSAVVQGVKSGRKFLAHVKIGSVCKCFNLGRSASAAPATRVRYATTEILESSEEGDSRDEL